MFVTAIAFAWWLVALPMKSRPAAALGMGGSAIASNVRSSRVIETSYTESADADLAPGERVPLRGAIPMDVVRTAQSFLDLPMGAERAVWLHETHYVFVLEWHYHPQGFIGAPTGWHKGVTVYLTR